MPSSRSLLILACLALCVFPACAQRRPPEPPRTAEDGLKELGELYKYIDYSKLAVPNRVEDLNNYWDSIQNAFDRVKNGEIVVYWGVGYSKSGNQILAYDKKAETEGGPVLLRDGTVKTMTAAEFKAAPKAK